MNERLLALLILLRIVLPILIAILIVAYLVVLTIEVLYISHTLETLLPLIKAHNKEIENAMKELNGIPQK